MRITSRQLRRIIRESLLNESAELKKLKKIYYTDNSDSQGEQAWELADSLGLSQQFESALVSDNKFLKKMFDIRPGTGRAENPLETDLEALLDNMGEPGGGKDYNPTTQSGKAFKKALENDALGIATNKRLERYFRGQIYHFWLTDEEKSQLDWKEIASALGTEGPISTGLYFDHYAGDATGPDPSDSDASSKYPGTQIALKHMATMGTEGVPDFFDWVRTLKERIRGQWVKAVVLKYGPELDNATKVQLFDMLSSSEALNDLSPAAFKNI